jgi:murein L,D-transpeptidase YafK
MEFALMLRVLKAFALSLILAVSLAACQGTEDLDFAPKANKDIPEKLMRVIKAKGMTRTSPIMVRVFKEEGQLEIWKRADTGRFEFVEDFEICKWSGKLGPKFIEGDRQAPEGFYAIAPGQMNPNSQYHLAFNTGYPNAFDRSHGRGGSHLMVHGACSSSGCYSMSDEQMEVIFAFAREAFRGGQKSFQFQAYPFRMTAKNMARYRDDPNIEFWRNLKQGYDLFEITKVPPRVGVCEKKYTFAAGVASGDAPMEACKPDEPSPALAAALAGKEKEVSAEMTAAISKSSYAAPAPTVQGLKEAKLVADWSKRRLRGERVSREPPSLANPSIAPAVAAAPKAEAETVASVAPESEAADATSAPATTADSSVSAAAPKADRVPAPADAAQPTAEATTAIASVAPAAASGDAPAVPTPNPNAPSLTNVSDDVVPLEPKKKKPWWKIIGD